MADLQAIQQRADKEIEVKRHQFAMKKIKSKNKDEYQKLAMKGEKDIVTLRKDYDSKFSIEKQNLEKKLKEIRTLNEQRIKEENYRYETELKELKQSHEQQMAELKTSYRKHTESVQLEQKEYLENARTKFEEKKAKIEDA